MMGHSKFIRRMLAEYRVSVASVLRDSLSRPNHANHRDEVASCLFVHTM